MTGVGLCLPQLGPHATGPAIKDFCHAAEDRGYTSLWVQEHLFVPVDAISGYGGAPGRALPTPYQSTLAALELLAAAAAWTTTPLIGTSVIVGGYHRPVELAQSLAAVDVLSQGRLVVGLGVGWSEDEHIQMNTDVHSRGRRLDELIDALKACWGPNPVEHRGEFFSIPSCLVNPKPVQHKLPMIGGAFSGPGLERVIDKLDGWNPAGLPVSTVATMARRRVGSGSTRMASISWSSFALL